MCNGTFQSLLIAPQLSSKIVFVFGIYTIVRSLDVTAPSTIKCGNCMFTQRSCKFLYPNRTVKQIIMLFWFNGILWARGSTISRIHAAINIAIRGPEYSVLREADRRVWCDILRSIQNWIYTHFAFRNAWVYSLLLAR